MSTIEYREELIAVGKELYARGLQTTRSGNISVRDGERFLITKTGTNLGRLIEPDLIEIDVSGQASIPAAASCESPVHRAIYNATEARAIIHAHPAHAIALAEISDAGGIRPIHNEGMAGLRWIPVVDTSVLGQDSGEDPGPIAHALTECTSVVVKNHGAFVTGSSLEQALYKMLLLEETCRIVFLVQSAQKASQRKSVASPTRRRVPAKWIGTR